MTSSDTTHSSGTTVLSDASWLDTHFEACRPTYEAIVQSLGLLPGWKVLDAGSGNGAFADCLKAAVGPAGQLFALDSSPDHFRDLEMGAAASIDHLPFADDSFDAVWCANTLQYLNDQQADQALSEFARVVRPHGLVAVKDVDMSGVRLYPTDAFLVHHLSEACAIAVDAPPESRGSIRGRELRRWLEKAGLGEVIQTSYLIEYWAPLSEAQERLWSDWIVYLAEIAETRGVVPDDLEEWRRLATGRGLPFVRSDDFYACELQVVAVGRVGKEASSWT